MLEEEDVELRAMFRKCKSLQRSDVEDRAEYGDLAKSVIRRVAQRESALTEIFGATSKTSGLESVTTVLEERLPERREVIDRVERMSRGVQGMNLNTGQDFDTEFSNLIGIIDEEIEWDLTLGVPAIRRALRTRSPGPSLRSADTLAKRAPTNLSAEGPKWYERAPVIARLLSIYDHLRDFPKAVRPR